MEAGKRRPGNYLSMDGGNDWLSALPALLTLEETMKRLQRDLDLPEAPLPCKVFDVIIASSHAAVAALLVGKMRLTPSQATDAYKKLEPALSVGLIEDEKEREQNMDAFKKAFIEILEGHGFDMHSSMLSKEQEGEAKIIICTQNATSLLSLHLIRSYRVRGARPADCTILQAACASIASLDRFPPVKIGSGYREITLINAIPNYANPTKILLSEARRIFGDEGNVAAIVSIGSGKFAVPDGLDSTHDDLFADKKDDISFKCEQVHEDVLTLLQKLFVYFRFNHNQIPGDTANDLSINARISAYLQEEETTEHLDNAVESMRARKPGGNLLDINVVDKDQVKLKPRPSVAPNFVGREDILETMRERHFKEHSNKTRMPAITVLSGLGGSGKTQIACKFADEFEVKCPNIPVYFLNSSSEDRLKADFETIIRSQGALYRSQSCEDALAWLSAKARKWCLILDNADDPSFNIFPYIPKSAQGNVIVTTRNSTHALLSPDDHYAVEGLPMADAVDLILKMAHYEATADNQLLAQAIVKELGSLPLALAHAGGYIFVHQCLPTYLDMYYASRAEFLDSNQLLPQDYQLSVATTVQMSLGKLPEVARDMMCVFSHLEVSSIPLQIISLSAERLFRAIADEEGEETVDQQTTQQADTLMAIFCPDGEWFELDFNISIQKCLEYSLLQITTRDDDRFFSMHILVQTYLQYSLGVIRHHRPKQLVARLLGSAITVDTNYKYHVFNRLLVPHLRILPANCVIEAGDHISFGHVLREQGSASLAVEHEKRCLALRMSRLGDEDLATMTAMSNLAVSYNELGKFQESLDLGEKVLELRTRISGNEHPNTLRAMGNLAVSYKELGRYQDALDLEEKMVELRIRISGDEHPNTLRAMGNLAVSYKDLGKYQDALNLGEKVVKLWTRIFGDEHPDTLLAVGNLAACYSELERYQESLDLEEKVLELRTRISGDEHPSTLRAMNNLAVSYRDLGRYQDSLDLYEKVFALYTRISGDEHPDTLRAMSNLAASYRRLGRYEESLDLREKALELRTHISGDEHPDTLRAMANLAASYKELERYQESLDLDGKILALQTRILGDEHPDILLTMGNLATSYHALGRYQESLDLDEKALKLRTRLSGDESPESLLSVRNLAVTLVNVGMKDRAISLLQAALLSPAKNQDLDHPDILMVRRFLESLIKISDDRLYSSSGGASADPPSEDDIYPRDNEVYFPYDYTSINEEDVPLADDEIWFPQEYTAINENVRLEDVEMWFS